jgi:DNA-binding transcriptional LysR family regulator
VIDSTHPLARRPRLRLADLDGLDLVVPPPQRPHRRALERALLDAGVSWQPTAEVDGWDLLIHFAALGIGATIVNGCAQVPDGLTATPVSDLPTVRYWAAWRRQRHPQPPDILDHLQQR